MKVELVKNRSQYLSLERLFNFLLRLNTAPDLTEEAYFDLIHEYGFMFDACADCFNPLSYCVCDRHC